MRLNPRRAGLILAIPLALSAGTATSQTKSPESAFTVYGAYRDGGSFIDATNDQKLRLDGSAAWAISFDKGLDGMRQLQFYVSYQNTDLGLERSAFATPPPGATPTAAAPLPMKVMYFHFGGTNFFDGPIGQGPYLVGGLGATLFLPGGSGYSDELRPSLNLGIGYQVTLGERVLEIACRQRRECFDGVHHACIVAVFVSTIVLVCVCFFWGWLVKGA